MQKNQLALIKPKWNVTIATRHVILLESVDSRELKIIGGGMYGILETRMGAELDKRRILKYGEVMGRSGLGQSFEDEIMLDGLHSSVQTQEREQLGDASIEIKGIFQGSKKLKHMLQSVFMNKESEIENQPLYDRFVIVEGMHVVPPPMTGNYMPLGPDVKVDDSNAEPSELVSEPVVNESNVKSTSLSDALSLRSMISTVGGKRETAVKPLAGCNWRPQRYHGGISKYIVDRLGNVTPSRYTRQTKPKQAWEMFRHHDKKQGLPDEFQDFNGGLVCFGGDNGTEFKNKDVIEFCGSKGIKREYSNARTPQQNGVAERKNRTLIEAARTMLADSFLPNTFWAEAVSTACYVLNRVLVTKPHNKTPYELLTGKIPIISYIRPFGCHVTILNTIDHLGKFAGKSDEGFLVGYSLQSKAFRVYNLETKRVEENLHITFLENKPNVAGKGPTWLFDLDYLTDSMNYHPVSSENQANLHAGQQEANQNAGTEEIIDVGDSDKEDDSAQDCFVLPIWPSYSSTNTPAVTTDDKRAGPREEEQVFMDDLERLKNQEKEAYEEAEALRKKFETLVIKEGAAKPSSTNIFSTVSTPAKASSTNPLNTASIPVSTASPYEGLSLDDPTHSEEDDSEIPPLEDIYQNSTDGIFTTSSFDDEGAVADFTNLETVVNVSPIPTSRIHSTHPRALILGDPNSAVQTRSKVNKSSGAHAFVSYVQKQKRTNHKDFHHCLFACFLALLHDLTNFGLARDDFYASRGIYPKKLPTTRKKRSSWKS
ncbi:ribonuclease H-like domain-containing protein [Tanacetum coccineum]|uniref:Ribonuclease H-like domain-containing protein n=1 Tax=Tanacetum coccineum TaxID=301880 RepID=A0ABQ4YLR7_9ASTR